MSFVTPVGKYCLFQLTISDQCDRNVFFIVY